MTGPTQAARPRKSGDFSVTERDLFETTRACAVCDRPLSIDDEETVSKGLLMFVRGEERRFEEPEVCGDCSQAITISALQRWESEEEEG